MASKITVDDKSLNKLLEKMAKQFPRETQRALTEIVLDLAAQSAKRAPIETGDLRNNCVARVDDAVVFANQSASGGAQASGRFMITATVGYSLPYALKQHEDLTLNHMRTDGKGGANRVAGGEAKYLERPFRENLQRYLARIRRVAKDATEGGGTS